MRVLVAGDRGYIGAVMVPLLSAAGHDVEGLDLGLYEGCDLGPAPAYPSGASTRAAYDMRDVTAGQLADYDAVICLAALSNDPLGDLNPGATHSVNLDGTMQLARAAKAAGAGRFLFASSCSLYGAAGSGAVAEDADLYPVTAYGETKVQAERALSALADDDFSPTYLRNATAYGASPRLRLDIVVNNLTAVATTTGEVRLQSDGTPWRPLVHGLDIARAIICALDAPIDAVHNQILNIGDSNQNYRIREIADIIDKIFPGCEITFGTVGADNRSYRVSFAKLARHLPSFRCEWDVEKGARQFRALFERVALTREMFDSPGFTRLKQLEYLIKTGQIDQDFYWRNGF